jgi:uncharacterized protein YcnI
MRIRRFTVAGVMAGVVLLAVAGPASAHVTIDPESVPQGAGDATVTFRVPNEETAADTIKVDIQFPTDHPIAAVDVAVPTGGFTAQVTMKHLDTPITTDDGTFSDVVSEIVWSGGKIPPGQYGEFKVLAMGIPSDVDSIKFPTIQSYSDGTDVSWIEDTPASGEAPEHPAPVLTLTAAAADSTASSSDASSSSSPSASSSQVAAPAASTIVKKESSNGLAVLALIVGGMGVLIGVGALVRKPRSTT